MADRPWEAEEPDEASVNFLREMVVSAPSGYGLLAALFTGAVLSFPLGLGVGALPLLGYAAAESIAALFVPSSPVFREWIMRKKRRERRDATREHLIEQLQARADPSAPQWRTWDRMRERLASLDALAAHRETGLTHRDVERLEEATVDYLGLWLAWLVMAERYRNTDEKKLSSKLKRIGRELDKDLGAVERKRLQKAKADLEGILERRASLWARATSLEAAMLAMADTFEEVYQRVVANPNSRTVSGELTEAVERMRVEEALDLAVDEELDDLFRRRNAARASQRASQGVAS
ncbi:MAG: hypothetical protein KTR31_21475 [Myxococcales bacterium]|nr:hypothetical protein [Myxococcales bacterium]